MKFPFNLRKKSADISDVAYIKPIIGDVGITNISGLPEYTRLIDKFSVPVLWQNIEKSFEAVVLVADERVAHVVTCASEKIDSNSLDTLYKNLRTHAYSVGNTVVASVDLMKRLRSVSLSNSGSSQIQQMKSEPMLRFRSWLEKAIEMNANDIHLETTGSAGRVRVRAHGEIWNLEDAVSGFYPAEQITETIGSIYQNLTQTSSNSASMWKPHTDSYTMLNYDLNGSLVKMRFQSSSGNLGPKAVLRIFRDSDSPSITMESLGYPDSQLLELRRAQRTSTGLVCVSGITGSGKTTTIRSFLETHPDNGRIIINTVEDPVELKIRGAHQKSVQRSFDDSEETVRKKFNGAVNAMLRSDIDIGMLGELRDAISANAWLNVAETGHMGIATLHAHRLTGITTRLVNESMGLSREILATPQMINLFMYQALIPANCPVCALSTDDALRNQEFDSVSLHDTLNVASSLDLDATYFKWRNPKGCSACNKRGTQGQALLAELLTPDYSWLNFIRSGDEIKANEYHRSRGVFDLKSDNLYSRSIVEHGLLKVQSGDIDIRTLMRFEKLSDFADNYNRLKGSSI